MGKRQQAAEADRESSTRLSLTMLLGQLDRQASRSLEKVISERGLTVDQWRALEMLADGQGHAMSQLAATLVVPGATMTKIMDKLVDAAYVYRVVDDTDRRRVLAFLSDKGKNLYSDLEAEVSTLEQVFVSSLTDSSDLFVALLSQLSEEHLNSARRGRA